MNESMDFLQTLDALIDRAAEGSKHGYELHGQAIRGGRIENCTKAGRRSY